MVHKLPLKELDFQYFVEAYFEYQFELEMNHPDLKSEFGDAVKELVAEIALEVVDYVLAEEYYGMVEVELVDKVVDADIQTEVAFVEMVEDAKDGNNYFEVDIAVVEIVYLKIEEIHLYQFGIIFDQIRDCHFEIYLLELN